MNREEAKKVIGSAILTAYKFIDCCDECFDGVVLEALADVREYLDEVEEEDEEEEVCPPKF